MDTIKNSEKIIEDVKNFSKNIIETGKKSIKNKEIMIFSIIIIILLLVFTIFYIYHKLTLNERNCTILKKVYTTIPKLNSVTTNSNYNNFLLRDFYIKSAYNCCSAGNFRNDFVNLCALSTCISQGVRFLDFEIYSINDKPVIATSSVMDFTVKETYNYIPIEDAFNLIIREAFSSGTCPNFNDPIILHFRIMSNNCKMYNNFTNIIMNNQQFIARTLGKKYSFEFKDPKYGSQNLGGVPISDLKGKIIIAIDAGNPLYQHTKLDEFINIASNSVYLKLLRFNDVKFTQDTTFTYFNKRNMSIVLPDMKNNATNPNFNISRHYGCQFIAMSFQNYDMNLQQYNDFFDSNRFAFVLKPARLRFKPTKISKPTPQDPKLSYETRTLESDFYKFNV